MILSFFKKINYLKICSKLFDFFILALIFGTPLYLSLFFQTSNIFDFAKLSWFQICLFLALIFLALKFVFLAWQKKEIFLPVFLKKSKLLWTSLLLLFFLLLSVLWSQDANQSFFGSYYRNDGLINWFAYFLFALLLSFYLLSGGPEKIKEKTKIVLITATSSATLVAIYGIFQYFGLDFLSWQEPANISRRTSSTLFQPNFFASFLLLTIPLAGFLFFSEKKKKFKYLFLSAGILQIVALIFSGSRGAWLAFSFSSLVFFVFLFLKNRKKIAGRFWLLGVLFLFALLIIFVFVNNNRFRQITNFSQGSSAYRLEIYRASVSQIKESPWLGFGYENQKDRLAREYQKDWAVFESVYLLPDRVHNLVLDLLLCFGFVGLFVWLAWYFSIFSRLFFLAKTPENFLLAFALSFAAFSYLFSLLFSFSVATTTIYFFLLLGIIIAISAPAKKIKIKKNRIIPGIFLLVIAVFCLNFSYRTILADYYFYYFSQAWNIQKYDSAFKMREKIIDLKIADRQYRRLMLEKMENFQILMQDQEILEKIKEISREDKKLFNKNLFFDLEVLLKIEAFEKNFSQSEEYAKQLFSFSPFYPRTYYLSGLVKFQEEKYDDARALFGQSLTLLPDSLDNRLSEKHKKELTAAKSEIFFAAGATHENQKNWRNASSYYGLAFLSNEKNLSALSRIAFCFDQLGESDRAEAIKIMLENLLKK